MTKTTAQFAAIALSALMSLGIVAGMNGLATTQFSAAERMALAGTSPTQVAMQRVVVVGHRANA